MKDKENAKRLLLEKKAADKAAAEKKLSTSPKDYFKEYEQNKYSQFDENGFPTHGPVKTGKDKKIIEGQPLKAAQLQNA